MRGKWSKRAAATRREKGGLMSELLDQAVSEARKLPVETQGAIAALILEEIEDDRRWDESFARSPDKLAALAKRAAEQVRAGRVREAGIDEI
jgi:hypothetical protein